MAARAIAVGGFLAGVLTSPRRCRTARGAAPAESCSPSPAGCSARPHSEAACGPRRSAPCISSRRWPPPGITWLAAAACGAALFISGVLYGIGVHVFMNYVVLPLSAAAKKWFS
jgi:hypothetical protein